MKECRWTFQRIIWAALLFLCCCGNVADDAKPTTVRDPILSEDHKIQDVNPVQADSNDEKVESLKTYGESSSDIPVITIDEASEKAVVSEIDNVARQTAVTSSTGEDDAREVLTEKSSTSQNASTSNDPTSLHVENDDEESTLRSMLGLGALSSSVAVDSISVSPESALTVTANITAENNNSKEGNLTQSDFSDTKQRDVSRNLIDETGSGTPSEEMPSFNEWAKKRLEEQEKNGQNSGSVASQGSKLIGKQKMRMKNYASTDCGAKVLSSNPEAQGTYAVLDHYTDDYMLNPCGTKIWLVIELCESIQVNRIEMANFELFSSSPKEFSVFSSDRYPSREWKLLGNFEAKDERVLQNFTLNHNTFGKFFKIEIGSHYGSEHYCPLSRLRVFGTSEFEALDSDESPDDSSDDKMKGSLEEDEFVDELNSSQESPNLFGTAKDAVISIVKKAAQALRTDKKEKSDSTDRNGSDELVRQNITSPGSNDTPSNCICLERLSEGNCDVNESLDEASLLLQCEFEHLKNFLLNIWHQYTNRRFHSYCYNLCYQQDDQQQNGNSLCKFYFAAFGKPRFEALCKLDKFLLEKKRGFSKEKGSCSFRNFSTTTVLQPSLEALGGGTNKKGTNVVVDPMLYSSQIKSTHDGETTTASEGKSVFESSDEMLKDFEKTSTISVSTNSESIEEKIVPSKTLPSDSAGDTEGEVTENTDLKNIERKETKSSDSQLENESLKASFTTPVTSSTNMESMAASPSLDSTEYLNLPKNLAGELDQGGCSVFPFASESPAPPPEDAVQNEQIIPSEVSTAQDVIPEPNVPASTTEQINGSDNARPANGKPSEDTGFLLQQMSAAQKESVFVRLTNRIKALELNMSLSSQYLEELSRRYKKQMEEMQKSFNKTILALNETAKMAYERDIKQQEIINELKLKLSNLSSLVDEIMEYRDSSWLGNISSGLLFKCIVLMILLTVLLGLLLLVYYLWTLVTSQPIVTSILDSSVVSRTSDEFESESQNFNAKLVKKKDQHRIPNIGKDLEKKIQSLECSSKSGLLLSNQSWESASTSSSSSVHTNVSWQEVENPKKRKKRNRNKTGLYRSMSSNTLDSNSVNHKPPIYPNSLSNSKGLLCPPKKKKTELSNAAGLLFKSSKSQRDALVTIQNRNTNNTVENNIFSHNLKSKWKEGMDDIKIERGCNMGQFVHSNNRFANLPHYESDIIPLKSSSFCKAKQTILDQAPNFSLKKSYTEVWG